jgi:hypothetical protein
MSILTGATTPQRTDGGAPEQIGPWTVGGLANHLVSFAGDDDRRDVSATFVQPFVSYTTGEA